MAKRRKIPLRVTGCNEPRETTESIDVQRELDQLEAERLADLEAQYVSALAAVAAGDRGRLRDLADVGDRLGWSSRRVGNDVARLRELDAARATVAAWTPEHQAEYSRLSKELQALHARDRHWTQVEHPRLKSGLLAERQPLATQRQGVVLARERIDAIEHDLVSLLAACEAQKTPKPAETAPAAPVPA